MLIVLDVHYMHLMLTDSFLTKLIKDYLPKRFRLFEKLDETQFTLLNNAIANFCPPMHTFCKIRWPSDILDKKLGIDDPTDSLDVTQGILDHIIKIRECRRGITEFNVFA